MANRKRKRRRQHNLLVLRLLILVVLVLIVFEGKLIHTMFTQRNNDLSDYSSGLDSDSSQSGSQVSSGNEADLSSEDSQTPDPAGTPSHSGGDSSRNGGDGASDVALAGISSTVPAEGGKSGGQSAAPAASDPEILYSDAVVPKQAVSVDDSYFRDAVFIGDSRMEGFRNTSGITQGTFLTSVGMTLTSITDTMVQTAEGNITVYQGLSGIQYGKIYLMLGTNDLGFYPMEEFLPTAVDVMEEIHNLQSDAVIYICSVIYVEEAKVTTDYVNNENVVTVNTDLLKVCEQLPYCHYLNLNEVLSDGYHSLIQDASQDGVHLYAEYSKLMLNYLKSHYISTEPSTVTAVSAHADAGTDSGSPEGDEPSGTSDDQKETETSTGEDGGSADNTSAVL